MGLVEYRQELADLQKECTECLNRAEEAEYFYDRTEEAYWLNEAWRLSDQINVLKDIISELEAENEEALYYESLELSL